MIYAMPFDLDGHHELRLVAIEDGQLVGTASVASIGAVACTLFQVFVTPTWRKRGIGGALVQEAESQLALRGAKAVSALVEANGPLNWWIARGFAVVHCEGARVIISKRLKG